MTPAPKLISYLRVSTDKQGLFGLGLAAQREAVGRYVAAMSAGLLCEFVEVESGKARRRPELERALAACRVHGATLIVAKLDRLARNASFLLSLQESGVEFVCADMPHANRLTIGILACVAEDEARRISDRTRAALAIAKSRGVRLGNPAHLTAAARARGTEASVCARRLKAEARARDLYPVVQEIRSNGLTSLRQIAVALSTRGVPAPAGGATWTAVQVQRALARVQPGG
jgi:DNA invertase Pin-like site-specific DNA recombinase